MIQYLSSNAHFLAFSWFDVMAHSIQIYFKHLLCSQPLMSLRSATHYHSGSYWPVGLKALIRSSHYVMWFLGQSEIETRVRLLSFSRLECCDDESNTSPWFDYSSIQQVISTLKNDSCCMIFFHSKLYFFASSSVVRSEWVISRTYSTNLPVPLSLLFTTMWDLFAVNNHYCKI